MNPEKFNLNRNDLETIVGRCFSDLKMKFNLNSAIVKPFSASRVGYLGDHFILELKVNSVSGEREQNLNLFLKVLPERIPSLTRYLEAIGTFRKEVRLYRDLFPKLSQFTRFAPEAYLSKDDRLLVFENLQLKGFRTISNTDTGIFDKAHLEKALEALAKFHCASLMLETKTGRTLPELCPGALDENCWIRKENNPRVEELQNAIDVLCELVKVVECENENLSDILEKLPPFMLQIYELVKPSSSSRNVACHGDLWGSNLMFQYSDDGVPLDCLIVDFQFTRYAPPAYDVNMLLTLTTTGEFRKQYYRELIDYYYSCVRQEFIVQCLSPEEIFPERQFQESCQRYRISGLIDNFLMNHVTLLPRSCVDQVFSSPENYNNFSGQDKIKMCLDVLESDAKYRTRLTGIIRDLVEAL
ncbi:uncharacterized protein LOC131679231 [Topomyia yanbarensis]|uniref:uncharacterized protein LOC131679231 n=1 Tax=Topomyia yanbarensis TaxID=2498891 RepID=UPI00273AE081|nr:uncharacterized protein LOC131679231 [Topomyia yanbarensis]